METFVIALDEKANKVVILPEIVFTNKQNINWNEVEKYLEHYVGELVEIVETGDAILGQKTSRMNIPVQNIQEKRKAAGQKRKFL